MSNLTSNDMRMLERSMDFLWSKESTHLENIAASVNVDETSEAFQNLYQTLLAAIGPELATTYYDGGLTVYRNEDFTAAIEQLGKAVYYDPTNAEALYYLGQAYRRSGDKENAAVIYEKVIDLFPGTQNAANAQRYLEEMGQSTN